MNQEKTILRTWLKAKRLALDKAEVERLSEIIQQKLIDQINWENLKTVSCYKAIESLNEVNTDRIIEHVAKTYPDIILSIQPQQESEIEKTRYDLIIVPTLAYDSMGYRLGWGNGFYDKLLASQPQALKIGLCFKLGHSKKLLPHEPHDIPLDKVITEV